MYYIYGMKLRGYAPGCQPMKGLRDWIDATETSKYHSFLLYDRKMTKDERKDYELDLLYLSDKEVL